MGRERPKILVIDYGLPRGIEPDNRFIEAERVLTHEERRIQEQEWQRPRDEEKYVEQMKEKGIQVEFPKDKTVEGYYIGIQEVSGRKYAMIDTHAVTTQFKERRLILPILFSEENNTCQVSLFPQRAYHDMIDINL